MDSKHVNIQITDYKGDIIDESTVFLKPGDFLVAQVPKGTSIEQVSKLHERLKGCLSSAEAPLIISKEIELKVIKKVKERD